MPVPLCERQRKRHRIRRWVPWLPASAGRCGVYLTVCHTRAITGVSCVALSARRCRGEEGDPDADGERQETNHLHIVGQAPLGILIPNGWSGGDRAGEVGVR